MILTKKLFLKIYVKNQYANNDTEDDNTIKINNRN